MVQTCPLRLYNRQRILLQLPQEQFAINVIPPVSLGEPVCIWCGVQLYTDDHGGKPGGISKIIPVICILIFVLALVGIGVSFLIEKGELLSGKPEWRDPQSLPNTVVELEELAGKGDANAQYKLAVMLIENKEFNRGLDENTRAQNLKWRGLLQIARDNDHKLEGKELDCFSGEV